MTNHVDKHDKVFQVDIASYALPTFHSTRQDLGYIVLLCKRLAGQSMDVAEFPSLVIQSVNVQKKSRRFHS